MREEAELNRALQSHADTVRRICFMHLHNRSDVEDVFQEVFLKYALRDAAFESPDHEKAWLLRVAINACRDLNKSFWRRGVFSLQDADATNLSIADGCGGVSHRGVSHREVSHREVSHREVSHREVLDAVLRLVPPKYRDVIYLYYYEGYRAAEIAAILKQKENTIYTWLTRARSQLKKALGGELLGE